VHESDSTDSFDMKGLEIIFGNNVPFHAGLLITCWPNIRSFTHSVFQNNYFNYEKLPNIEKRCNTFYLNQAKNSTKI
jgi:hypothetical protein